MIQSPEPPERYLVRRGMTGWIVWDRQGKGPTKTEIGLASGLSKERAEEVLDELRGLREFPD